MTKQREDARGLRDYRVNDYRRWLDKFIDRRTNIWSKRFL